MPKIIKKRILKRQLAYAIMAVAKKEIIKSKQHTPFLLPDWVRQRWILYHRGRNATISHFPLFTGKAIRKRASRAVADRSVYPWCSFLLAIISEGKMAVRLFRYFPSESNKRKNSKLIETRNYLLFNCCYSSSHSCWHISIGHCCRYTNMCINLSSSRFLS